VARAKSKRARQGRSASRQEDLGIVRSALRVLKTVPALDLFGADYSLAKRAALRRQLQIDFRPLFFPLERLCAEFAPELAVPNPLVCISNKRSIGTPIANVLNCHDVCAHCIEEARRTLSFLEARLMGSLTDVDFPVPVQLIAERIAAWRQKQVERERRDMELRKLQFSPFDNRGKLSFGQVRIVQDNLPKLDQTDREILGVLMKSHPQRLITSAIAERTRRSAGVIGKNLKKLCDMGLLRNPRDRKGYGMTEEGLRSPQ
jgi:hypothetical protein